MGNEGRHSRQGAPGMGNEVRKSRQGAPGTTYPQSGRGFDAFDSVKPDYFSLSADRRTVSFDLQTAAFSDDIRVLTPESRAKIDVIVNASTALRPSDREYFAIQSRIDAGAGYVGVHVANTVHLTSPNFLHAVDVAPPPRDSLSPTMSVRILSQAHPITAGLEDYDHDNND